MYHTHLIWVSDPIIDNHCNVTRSFFWHLINAVLDTRKLKNLVYIPLYNHEIYLNQGNSSMKIDDQLSFVISSNICFLFFFFENDSYRLNVSFHLLIAKVKLLRELHFILQDTKFVFDIIFEFNAYLKVEARKRSISEQWDHY